MFLGFLVFKCCCLWFVVRLLFVESLFPVLTNVKQPKLDEPGIGSSDPAQETRRGG